MLCYFWQETGNYASIIIIKNNLELIIAYGVLGFWGLFDEAENPTEAKHILDSIRAAQHDLALFYNETPLVEKVKQTLETRLEALNGKQTIIS